jgi:hypothetical protein
MRCQFKSFICVTAIAAGFVFVAADAQAQSKRAVPYRNSFAKTSPKSFNARGATAGSTANNNFGSTNNYVNPAFNQYGNYPYSSYPNQYGTNPYMPYPNQYPGQFNGYNQGFNSGFNQGFNPGFNQGFNPGVNPYGYNPYGVNPYAGNPYGYYRGY